MKVVLFGSNGQVGSALFDILPRDWTVISFSRQQVDLAEPGAAAAVIRRLEPDAVINAAAWTAVDKAESEPEAARRINAETPAEMAAAIGRGWLISYSTDYVFDGTNASAYIENDTPNPLNVYGDSKLGGERAIAASGCRHVVFRTSWVHAPGHNNFIAAILKRAMERDQLQVVDDQVGAPTSAALIAEVTLRALDGIATGRPIASGLYHLTASGATNWYDYAAFLLSHALEQGLALQCRSDGLTPVSSSQYQQAASRPANSRLDTTKLQNALGITLPPWQDGVRKSVQDHLALQSGRARSHLPEYH